MSDPIKSPIARVAEPSGQDVPMRTNSPTFLRNRSLTRGMEAGLEGFKLRSRLLKTKLTKQETEQVIEELAKIKIVNLEDLSNLDNQTILSLPVKPRVRAILVQTVKQYCESFRLKELFVESNAFNANFGTSATCNEACERVARSMYADLGLKRWKEFFQVTPNDLADIVEVSAEEAVQVSDLIKFGKEVNWGSIKNQYDQLTQSMETALKNYAELLKNLNLFQNFVTVGVPMDASLNELANLKTKLFYQRDAFVRGLSDNVVGESVEEDPATHSSRPSSIQLNPGNTTWKIEPTVELTSFRQQIRSLQLDTTTNTSKVFRKSFVDGNLNFLNFVGEKKISNSDDVYDPDAMESALITFEKKKTASPGDFSLLLIQTSKGDETLRMPAVTKTKDMIEALSKTPSLSEYELYRVKDPSGDFKKSMLTLEAKLTVSHAKIGVLYVKPGQTKEDEYFSNNSGSKAYEDFLAILGDRISLKGWKKFAAGLDTRDGRNGSHSIFTNIEELSVMFHVSTMFPYENENEEQKLERKRHLGNDVTCIVFADEGATFNPASIRSEFIHVYAIVSPVTYNNRIYYRLQIVTKEGLTAFGPKLPNCLFPKTKQFAQFLVTKLINSESAAANAPVFKKRIMRTRIGLMNDIVLTAKAAKQLRAKGQKSSLEREPYSKQLSLASLSSSAKTVRSTDSPETKPAKSPRNSDIRH